MTKQLRIVERDAEFPNVVTEEVAFFDADGNPVDLGGEAATPLTFTGEDGVVALKSNGTVTIGVAEGKTLVTPAEIEDEAPNDTVGNLATYINNLVGLLVDAGVLVEADGE